MVEFEADDALGAAAAAGRDDPAVERVIILSPDKDMAQCVREDARVVCFDRRSGASIDAAAVRAKFGVPPASIPDYLALVGDSADGYPGLPGWGAKSAAAVLPRYPHLEAIPERASQWDVVGARRADPGRQPARPARRRVPVPGAGHAPLGRANPGDAR